jgi:hypothetical protein
MPRAAGTGLTAREVDAGEHEPFFQAQPGAFSQISCPEIWVQLMLTQGVDWATQESEHHLHPLFVQSELMCQVLQSGVPQAAGLEVA